MPLFQETLRNIDLWWWILGGGFLLLLVTLLLLARLRVIQTRPIRACIVLSVLAHVLIFGSAQLLRLFDVPRFPGDNTIQFQLSFDEETTEAAKPEPEEAADETAVTRPPELQLSEAVKVEQQPPTPEQAEVAPPQPPESTLVMNDSPPEPTLGPIPEPPPLVLEPIDQPPAALIDPAPLVMDAWEEITQDEQQAADVESDSLGPGKKEIDELPAEPRLADSPTTAVAPTPTASTDNLDSQREPDTSERMVEVPPASTKATVEDGEWRQPTPIASPVAPRYRLRAPERRTAIIKKRGGTRSTEEAVEAALTWLARNQESNGSWSAARHQAGRGGFVDGQLRQTTGIAADTGVSGLALLAMLGAGNTHQGGPHKKNVQAGLEFLMSQQRGDGCLGGAASAFAQMYCHGIATLALCEAYGMTKDERLEPFTRRAVEFTVRSQHRATGGWRYYPGDPGDTSQFGWQLMVVENARQSGIRVPEQTRRLTHAFLSRVSSGSFNGLAGYRPGQAPTVTMTAEALACRAFLGDVDERLLREAASYIMRHPPAASHRNLYYWYYGTMALYQLNSEAWPSWNSALQNELLPTQVRGGTQAGSWDTETVWGGCGGRVYTTAMAALCLEVYYRYAPEFPHEMARRQ